MASIAAFRKKDDFERLNIGGTVIKAQSDTKDRPDLPLSEVKTVEGEPIPNARANVVTSHNTFGTTNRYGYTRGAATNNLASYSTERARNRVAGGAFGTGTARMQAVLTSVTYLGDYKE